MLGQNHAIRRMRNFQFSGLRNAALSSSGTVPPKVKRLLEVNFKNVKCDYIFIRDMPSNQGVLVCHRKRRYQLAVVRQSYATVPLRMLEAFSTVQHPNVADIVGAYFHAGELRIVGEYLLVSLLDLGFDDQAPEEWEIATVVKQVRPCSSSRLQPAHLDRLAGQ